MGWKFLTASGTQKTSATVDAPAGAVMDFAGASAPSGWIICDGSAISQVTYANLFAVVGATYNTGGEPMGTFRVPDFRGRVSVAPDAGQGRISTNNTLGATSGEQTVGLSVANLPAHDHGGVSGAPSNNTSGGPNTSNTGIESVGHTHTQQGTFGSGGVTANHRHFPSNSQGFVTGPIQQTNLTTGGALSRWLGQSFAPDGNTTTENADHGHNTTISGQTQGVSANHTHTLNSHTHTLNSHTHTIPSAGSGTSHANLQPYIVLNKIIKY